MLLQMGIPAFFYISGFSATFWNTRKYHFCHFFWDKLKRYIFPLIVGILVFLIPRLYFTQDYSLFGRYREQEDYNFFHYYGQMVAGKFLLKISWLWFLIALFIDSLINYPLLKWT